VTPGPHSLAITSRPLADLKEIGHYIRKNPSAEVAAAVVDEIISTIWGLSQLPASFKQVGVSRETGAPVHMRVVQPSSSTIAWNRNLRR
jgi:plasmid stabilization system protein ParE